MGECKNCGCLAKYDLCYMCIKEPYVTISLTEAKNKYKLTDDELDESGIYCDTFWLYHVKCKKYLRKEVDDLANELTQELPNTDKFRAAYLKQHGLFLEQIAKHDEVINQKKRILAQLDKLMEKVDADYNYMRHGDIIKLIDELAADKGKSVTEATTQLLTRIQEHLGKVKRTKQSIKKLN